MKIKNTKAKAQTQIQTQKTSCSAQKGGVTCRCKHLQSILIKLFLIREDKELNFAPSDMTFMKNLRK